MNKNEHNKIRAIKYLAAFYLKFNKFIYYFFSF